MEADLKDCPFCGEKAEIKQTGKNEMQVRCTDCHIGIKQKTLRLGLDWLRTNLIESWNKRTI